MQSRVIVHVLEKLKDVLSPLLGTRWCMKACLNTKLIVMQMVKSPNAAAHGY